LALLAIEVSNDTLYIIRYMYWNYRQNNKEDIQGEEKMKDKIKAFLVNTKVQIVEFVVLAVSATGLILGGVSVDGINSVIQLVGGGITAIGAIITAISALVNKK
jgi:heme O synthase-like polyprenyltransferase